MALFWDMSVVRPSSSGGGCLSLFHAVWVKEWLTFGLLFCCLALSHKTSAAATPGADPAAVLMLEIPAQNLAGALDAFSRLTGMAVLVDRELTRGRRSLALDGRYTPRDGLARLLTGSGLMARYARADAFTVQVAQVDDPEPGDEPASASVAAAGHSYAQAIQQAIERVYCRSALTRPGSFRAVLQVWIGQGGDIRHSRLVAPTGNTQRDAALVESLNNVNVGRGAPSSLRQPVTLLLVPDSTGKRMDCKQWEGAGTQ
jgi:hypothetical protein